MTDSEEYIEVLFNNCYSTYRLPTEVVDLYKTRRGIPDAQHILGNNIPRHDPVLVGIFKESPELFTRHGCIMELDEIQAKYADFYKIREYGGNEWIEILCEKHALCLISTLVDDPDLPAELKLEKIREVTAKFPNKKKTTHP